MAQPNGNNGSPWTVGVDTLLKAYYRQGLSDRTIAELLNVATVDGSPFTRDSVKNRAARLGLAKPDSLFTRPREFKTVNILEARDGDRGFIFNDLHVPYHDRKTLVPLNAFIRYLEPNLFVLNGDGQDFYELSVYDKNPTRTKTLQDELDIGSELAQDWDSWLPDDARKYWIGGNHEDRLRKWLWRYGALNSLRSLELAQLLDLPDSWQYLPYGSQINYLGFLIEHGEIVRNQAAYTARAMFEKRGSSGLCGHTHRLGIYNRRDSRGIHSYIENGCLCRLEAEYVQLADWQQAFTYGFAQGNRFHWVTVPVYQTGFRAEGRWWAREV